VENDRGSSVKVHVGRCVGHGGKRWSMTLRRTSVQQVPHQPRLSTECLVSGLFVNSIETETSVMHHR
jgi:hypothetical protein